LSFIIRAMVSGTADAVVASELVERTGDAAHYSIA
jgi:hypothetical protein